MSRSHTVIIKQSGGPTVLARLLGIEPNTVFPWRRKNSIPSRHWTKIASLKLATLRELADAAAERDAPADREVA